jgi:hypothetical protein
VGAGTVTTAHHLTERASHSTIRLMASKTRPALTFGVDAGVAQLAEQLFCKQQVTGSIPVAGSKGGCDGR